MNTMSDQGKVYGAVFLLGVVVGGPFVTLTTRAIPKMMSQMMSGMMQNMMSRMSENGCGPSEM